MTVETVDIEQLCESASDDLAIRGVCTLSGTIADTAYGVDTFFLLFAGALVFLMQAGFAMLCAGSVRQKNVKNIMLKNILDACGGALGFYTVGYAFAYGGTERDSLSFWTDEGLLADKTWLGNANYALQDVNDGAGYIGFFFQFAFAATAATIVAGTVAERCKMSAYLCYSLFLTGFVYPVVVHAIWNSSGFLTAFADNPYKGVGNIDFAGSGVVHMTGGLTALIAATILGPRLGRFYDEDGRPLAVPVTFPAHSTALQVLGTFVLWFGWYGFNPGSALAIANVDSSYTAALSAVTTTLAAASGCVSAMFTDSILVCSSTGETTYDLTCAMNGCLSGLVAITAGCCVVDPWAAVVIGIVAGWVYLIFSKLLVALRIDDAVDAVPVHFANGFWGVLAVGLFAKAEHMGPAGYVTDYQGLFYELEENDFSLEDGGANLLVCQLAALASIIGWVTFTMTPFFLMLSTFGMLRVDAEEEELGLDLSHHGGAAYDLDAPKKEDLDNMISEMRASSHGKMFISNTVVPPSQTVPLTGGTSGSGGARKQLEAEEF